MSQAAISVVIPAFDAAGHLPQSLGSIAAQGVDGVEVVVVDDGSSDDTPVVLDRLAADLPLPVSIVRQANAGPAAARNRGIEHASAPVIAFLDADDRWPEGSLATRLVALEGAPEIDVVHGRTRFFREDGEEGFPTRLDADGATRGTFLGAGLFRRRAFEVVGVFDEDRRQGEDYDWFLRAREAGLRIEQIDEVTLEYRFHPGGMSRDTDEGNAHLLAALRDSIARRRR